MKIRDGMESTFSLFIRTTYPYIFDFTRFEHTTQPFNLECTTLPLPHLIKSYAQYSRWWLMWENIICTGTCLKLSFSSITICISIYTTNKHSQTDISILNYITLDFHSFFKNFHFSQSLYPFSNTHDIMNMILT